MGVPPMPGAMRAEILLLKTTCHNKLSAFHRQIEDRLSPKHIPRDSYAKHGNPIPAAAQSLHPIALLAGFAHDALAGRLHGQSVAHIVLNRGYTEIKSSPPKYEDADANADEFLRAHPSGRIGRRRGVVSQGPRRGGQGDGSGS